MAPGMGWTFSAPWWCMTYETWIWAQLCASADHLQERHVRPFLTTALWSQLQAASEAPFGLCVWLSWNSYWVHFFPRQRSNMIPGMKWNERIFWWQSTCQTLKQKYNRWPIELNIHKLYYDLDLDWHECCLATSRQMRNISNGRKNHGTMNLAY